jgi:hypothetical protein
MRWREACALFAVLGTLASASPVAATLSDALSLDELSWQADEVVLGRVLERRARRAGSGRIVTDTSVQVEDTVKGSSTQGEVLSVTTLGGELGDLGMRVEGEARLEVGARYVLFLRRLDRTLRPVGMSQGALPVREDTAGLTVLPGGQGLSLVHRVRGGALAPAPSALLHPQPYEQLRERVREALAAQPPNAGSDGESGAVRP